MHGDRLFRSFPHCVKNGLLFLCGLALTLVTMPAAAADGFYDTTFGSGGRHLLAVYTVSFGIRLHILADGTLLVGGSCVGHAGPGVTTICLAWFRSDGKTTADAYGAAGNGTTFLDNFSGFPQYGGLQDMTVLADGRIVVLASSAGGSAYIAIVRADGKDFDHSVAGGKGWTAIDFGSVDSGVNALTVQSDGEVIVAGNVSNQNTVAYDMAVARLTSDLGGLDPQFNGGQPKAIGFNLGGSNNDVASAVAVQADNKIVVAGIAGTATASDLAFARLLPDGSLDNSTNDPGSGFGPLQDGRAQFPFGGNPTLNAILLDRRGRIVFGGGWLGNWLIGRLPTDGSGFDPAFNNGSVQAFFVQLGVGGNQYVAQLVQQSDDKIIATGVGPRTDQSSQDFWGEARLLDNGSLDNSFGNQGRGVGTFTDASLGGGFDDIGSAVAVGDGGIVFAGTGRASGSDAYEFGVARVQLDLIFEGTFE